MEYVIKMATFEEAKLINGFLTRLIRDEKQYDKNINEKCVVTSLYENLIKNKNNCLLVAKNDMNIIGYLYGFIIDNGDAYVLKVAQLDAMFVDEENREKAIGSHLIENFKKWAKQKGVSNIELKVCADNKKAIDLYKKQGFKNSKVIMNLELEG